VERAFEQLALEPPKATILQDGRQPYQAIGVAKDGSRHDVTAQTGFTITGPGPGECPRDQLGKVSCTASEVGDYTVKGTLRQEGKDDVTDEAVLRVDPVVASLKLKPPGPPNGAAHSLHRGGTGFVETLAAASPGRDSPPSTRRGRVQGNIPRPPFSQSTYAERAHPCRCRRPQ
jgi:hypothetical protein